MNINKYLHYFFFGVWLTSVVGFHKNYTSKFPAFEGVNWIQHFHGTVMMLWYVLLISQTLLLRYKKTTWHSATVKVAYVLGPLVVYTIFLITRMMYQRDIVIRPVERVFGHLSVEIPSMILFSVFFILATIYRNNLETYQRYMVATSLLMIGPGLGRAIIFVLGLSPIIALIVIYLLPAIIAAVFLWRDKRSKQNTKTFTVILILMVGYAIGGACQMSKGWQWFAQWFANSFF